jgi:hypothetical protein
MRIGKATWNKVWVFAVSVGLVLCSAAGALKVPVVSGQERREVAVPGNTAWSDTGLDVLEGQEILFRAVGQISLQRGNPVTYCGPEGYNYRSLQQPLHERNIGALIGKVYFLISVETDEETGEEIRNEREEIFYIGSASRIRMPMAGRLFLGINENLVVDNEGVFTVLIYSDYYLPGSSPGIFP